MSKVIGIDPGPKHSGFALIDLPAPNIQATISSVDEYPNGDLVSDLEDGKWGDDLVVVIEEVVNYGKIVGREVFDTVFWTGRFYQAAVVYAGAARVPNGDIRDHFCGTRKTNDSGVRAAIIDRFGGKAQAIGLKAKQGPLYRVHGPHAWSALAMALYWEATRDVR